MITATLRIEKKVSHKQYLQMRTTNPFKKSESRIPLDEIYENIVKARTEKKVTRRLHEQMAWITDETWRLIDERAGIWANRETLPGHKAKLDRVNYKIRRRLKIDIKSRIINVGNLVEEHLIKGNDREAW